MITKIIFNVLGIIVFLFLFWRRLKEDYTSSAIFSTSFYMLTGLALAFLLSGNFFPSSSFWVIFNGLSLGLAVGALRHRMRVFEAIDAASLSLLPWLGFFFLEDAIVNSSLTSLTASTVALALIILFFVLDKRYKRFSWYKSGRVGFSGLTILGLLFLLRAAVAPIYPNVLSFAGNYEPFASGIVAFVFFLLVFNLSRQTA